MPKLPFSGVNIIHLLGIESLPLDERKEIVESAIELVETRAFNRVNEVLGEEKKRELANLIQSQDADAMGDFLEKNNIDLIAITESEVEKVKKELLEVSREK